MAKLSRRQKEQLILMAAEFGYMILALRDMGFDEEQIFEFLHACDIRKAISSEEEALEAFASVGRSLNNVS